MRSTPEWKPGSGRSRRNFPCICPNRKIAQINAKAGQEPVTVSQRTFDLLRRAKELSEQSGGAFDITIAPVVELWGDHMATD